mgnify:CR=1 FL=1
MRDQGRLVEWFDDKGYGFIQPNDSSKERVFLHIKDFARPGPRPIVGCALEYLIILDERGRHRAQQVTYLKASQIQPKPKRAKDNIVRMPQKTSPMQILCIAYILALAVLSFAGLLNGTALLAISFVKGRLVVLDFMGLRGVKFFWRGLLIGWLLLVSALIALAYWIALK